MEFKKIVSRTSKFSGVIDYNFNIKILIKILIIVSVIKLLVVAK